MRFQWIPGHSSIHGNDEVKKVAYLAHQAAPSCFNHSVLRHQTSRQTLLQPTFTRDMVRESQTVFPVTHCWPPSP